MPQFVIAYDVHNDYRRESVAKILLRYGERIQRSVFVAWLDPDEHAQLRRELGNHLRQADCLELFPVDTRHRHRQVSWDNDPTTSVDVNVVD